MSTRKERLGKLVKVQEQLKALHETRHATFLAHAASAEAEAKALVEHFGSSDALSSQFPDLYHRRIVNAVTRKEASLESARQEATLVAAATARVDMVERSYQDARRRDERERSDRERLELIEQKRSEE